MTHHRAYGLTLDSLDVVVVDDAKPMQTILRSILLASHVARVRAFDTAEAAMQSMIVEPPHLIITDWNMQPTDGLTLLRSMRRWRMGQVALVPAILITAHPTRALVESALAAGTHFVVAKPLSPATLMKRIDFILKDAREFNVSSDDMSVVLAGQHERIANERKRWNETYQGGLHQLQSKSEFAAGTPRRPEPPANPSLLKEIAAADADSRSKENLPDHSGRLGGFAPVALPVRKRLAGMRDLGHPGTGQAAVGDA
jgi:two-component system, OmpR family, phosphate regulon response regulator PhoB